MTTTQWMISVTAALMGGGAMGAVITALATRFRGRRQPIAYTKEIIQVFKKNPEIPSLQAAFMIGDRLVGDGTAGIENFSIARFTLINRGNVDMALHKTPAAHNNSSPLHINWG